MDAQKKIWQLIGYAAGFGGVNEGSDSAPYYFKKYLADAHFSNVHWRSILEAPEAKSSVDLTTRLLHLTQDHERQIAQVIQEDLPFTVIGGDHTAALGTWRGVAKTISPLGLLWVDAHMDSHTPETTESGRLHGMPLACLLGFGDKRLTQFNSQHAVLKPEHVCLLGVRSYEPGEAKLLSDLGVRIFYMEEIKHRGLLELLPEILTIITSGTKGFGLSIDLDAIDPQEAPGVDVPEAGGIPYAAFMQLLNELIQHPLWKGSEIVEYNPQKDIQNKTAKIMKDIIHLFLNKNVQ